MTLQLVAAPANPSKLATAIAADHTVPDCIRHQIRTKSVDPLRLTGCPVHEALWRCFHQTSQLPVPCPAAQLTLQLHAPRTVPQSSTGRRRSWARRTGTACAACIGNGNNTQISILIDSHKPRGGRCRSLLVQPSQCKPQHPPACCCCYCKLCHE